MSTVTDRQHVPDLTFIRDRMPSRSDRDAFRLHALRFFEDVLAYAERLEEEVAAARSPQP
jgi:hypothetical protein